MMVGSKSSNQRPDTLMQDRICQIDENLLQRTAGPYMGSISTESPNLAYELMSASTENDQDRATSRHVAIDGRAAARAEQG
jgi:hypothetical protein